MSPHNQNFNRCRARRTWFRAKRVGWWWCACWRLGSFSEIRKVYRQRIHTCCDEPSWRLRFCGPMDSRSSSRPRLLVGNVLLCLWVAIPLGLRVLAGKSSSFAAWICCHSSSEPTSWRWRYQVVVETRWGRPKLYFEQTQLSFWAADPVSIVRGRVGMQHNSWQNATLHYSIVPNPRAQYGIWRPIWAVQCNWQNNIALLHTRCCRGKDELENWFAKSDRHMYQQTNIDKYIRCHRES